MSLSAAAARRRIVELRAGLEAELARVEDELRRLSRRRTLLIPLLRRARYGEGEPEVVEAMLRRDGIEFPRSETSTGLACVPKTHDNAAAIAPGEHYYDGREEGDARGSGSDRTT